MKIDLNADVGEGWDDDALLPVVTSINVACGAHAGDAATMRRCVRAALRLGLALGAHPSYPDREGFGRRTVGLSPEAVTATVAEQLEALAEIAASEGGRIGHLKPHGALYNDAAAGGDLADAIVDAVVSFGDRDLILVGLAQSSLIKAGKARGVRTAAEGFADRRYLRDGTLAPRALPGAVIEEPAAAAEQAAAIVEGRPIDTLDGSEIVIAADTLCIHADSPGAAASASAVRARLESLGVTIAPLR